MLEVAETTATALSEEIVRSQQPGELQNIQAAYRLNGKNYLKWSQCQWIAQLSKLAVHTYSCPNLLPKLLAVHTYSCPNLLPKLLLLSMDSTAVQTCCPHLQLSKLAAQTTCCPHLQLSKLVKTIYRLHILYSEDIFSFPDIAPL
jgi:hypothetical protein